jgi:hypothetical protein
LREDFPSLFQMEDRYSNSVYNLFIFVYTRAYDKPQADHGGQVPWADQLHNVGDNNLDDSNRTTQHYNDPGE